MSGAPCATCGGTGIEPAPGRLVVDVTMPIRTISEANRFEGGRRGKIARKKAQREAAWLRLLAAQGVCRVTPAMFDVGLTVELTRIAPGTLDAHDNLPSALKHVVDGVSDWLGVDDRDERVTWLPPKQRKAAHGHYAVRVVIRERRPA